MTTNLKAMKQLLRTINHAITQPKVRSDRIEEVCSVSEFCNLFEVICMIYSPNNILICMIDSLSSGLSYCMIDSPLGLSQSFKVDSLYWLSLKL